MYYNTQLKELIKQIILISQKINTNEILIQDLKRKNINNVSLYPFKYANI